MRTLFLCLLMSLLTFGLVVSEANAKRFGGGRSFGVQRSHNSLFKQNTSQNTSAFAQRGNKSRWGGMLGGMLLGGLLASLFMGNGLMNGLMTWLILGSILFFIVNFLRRKMHPGYQTSQTNQAFNQSPFSQFTQANNSHQSTVSNHPAGFNADTFTRNAKVTFIRMQTAYDQKNLQDLQTFTAPEVFAEIKMQLEERGNEPNITEVITLNAELLDISKQAGSTMASVRFTGSIKENAEVSTLDEIWHFRQFTPGSEWVVGGIQQEVAQPL